MPICDAVDVIQTLVDDHFARFGQAITDAGLTDAGRQWREQLDAAYQRQAWGMTADATNSMLALVENTRAKKRR